MKNVHQTQRAENLREFEDQSKKSRGGKLAQIEEEDEDDAALLGKRTISMSNIMGSLEGAIDSTRRKRTSSLNHALRDDTISSSEDEDLISERVD